ncbi:DUF397 domain-containing protein [Amycolatopsis sp. NBC_01480]|uniref:DUF397 domain-containing protein n=1 Tax=Amycolatopsis sp. NBC_01480 TaxID=2903562 RepID=UPI002E2A9481|nr:DUF397 domain-containing protein [Amycolatopsis sp. NBC_01480]
MSTPPADDKAHVRHELDLDQVEWRSTAPADAGDVEDWAEYAFVPHSDGVTYVALRQSRTVGVTLVFTPSEWDAFVKGVRDGEFDLPG